ncbi:MAG: hypothetical protein C4523_19150 [Myxococcales bacterium]|nr:MAG: hypothetical protein C4523_19150 [Myxococcales bacterium]
MRKLAPLVIVLLAGLAFYACDSGDDNDGDTDGDQATDGDEVTDGDQTTDGDEPTDGDQPTDGDEPTDGDQPTDGDEPTDGDTDGDEEAEEAPPLPDDAFGYADDPLPDGAQEITEEEFNQMVENGEAAPASTETTVQQEEAALQQDAADEATIAAFLAANPGLGDIIPPDPDPTDPTVEPTPDGNYSHEIERSDDEGRGPRKRIITMGRRWWLRTIAQGIQVFPTWDNQFQTYRTLYEGLPSEWQAELQLPDPTLIEENPGQFPVESLIDYNGRLGELSDSIIGSIQFDPGGTPPEGYPASCADEEGSGTGGDRSSCSYSNPNCGFKPNGIWENYSWPNKFFNTCVKDQAARGSCVSFSNAAAIEFHVAKKFNNWVNLSEQGYYNRMKLDWGREDYWDGFWCDLAFNSMYTQNWLLYFENQWNYNPSWSRITNDDTLYMGNSCVGYTETCSDTAHQSQLYCFDFGFFRFCGYGVPEKNPGFAGYRIKTSAQFWDPANRNLSFAKLILAVAFGNPVSIGVPVPPSWDAAGNGVISNGFMQPPFDTAETSRGGHAVLVTGFIDNSMLADRLPDAPLGEGGGYFIIKNSWSNCWGDGGYIYAPYRWIKENVGDATVLHGVQ